MVGSLYQINKLYQYHLPGKLVCVLIKLAVIKELRIEFTYSDQYDVQTMTLVSQLSVFSVTCIMWIY